MMPGVSRAPRPAFAVTRRRSAFGLDAPRAPDLRRTEAAILDWIGAKTPQVLVLRVEDPVMAATPRTSSTLVLLLPGGRIAILRVTIRPQGLDSGTMALAGQCRTRRVPLAVVADVEDARAALRRLGVEPEEA